MLKMQWLNSPLAPNDFKGESPLDLPGTLRGTSREERMAQDGEDQQKRQEEIVGIGTDQLAKDDRHCLDSWATLGLSCLAWRRSAGCLGALNASGAAANNPPPSMRFGTLQIVQTIISLVTSSLLIAAGIQTLRRSFSGRTLHLIWAVLSVLAVIYGGFAGWHQQQEQLIWACEIRTIPSRSRLFRGSRFRLQSWGSFSASSRPGPCSA